MADQSRASLVDLLRMPAGAVLPDPSPEGPAPGERLPHHGPGCFGCGVQSAAGLRLDLRAGSGCTVHARTVLREEHEGAPGIAHGGVVAALLDEVLGGLHWVLHVPWVTGRLMTDYLAPLPTGSRVEAVAEVLGMCGRQVYCQGEVRSDGGGTVYARAAGVFVVVDLQHFREHGRALPV